MPGLFAELYRSSLCHMVQKLQAFMSVANLGTYTLHKKFFRWKKTYSKDRDKFDLTRVDIFSYMKCHKFFFALFMPVKSVNICILIIFLPIIHIKIDYSTDVQLLESMRRSDHFLLKSWHKNLEDI